LILVEHRISNIKDSMIIQAVKWIGGVDGFLELIDQKRLPVEFIKIQCRDIEQLYDAIKTLAVRGAPAIGVSAAYGPVLSLQKLHSESSIQRGFDAIIKACEYLASARPTAVNLFWALNRVRQCADGFVASNPDAKVKQLHEVVFGEANSVYHEDIDMCLCIGQNGEKFIKDGFGVLTHCNAGALATAGQGTALSVLFEAHKKGKKFKVYVDETRPLLQGARLTAWELKQAGIETVLICDNTAGWLMRQGKINAVITGADRIAANGDAANKVGTYSLSILARNHNIPFYIAAPSSTFDLSMDSGDKIPIEQRAADEVTFFGGRKIAPEGVVVYNSAFDVTEAKNITAIITEKGVIENPDTESIRKCLL
jgi:methylthioribose-1-phosphate isomerase